MTHQESNYKWTTIEALQQLQATDPQQALELIDLIEKMVFDPRNLQKPNSQQAVELLRLIEEIGADPNWKYSALTEPRKFALQWHCAKQYAIVVLGVPNPTPDFLLKICQSLYPHQLGAPNQFKAPDLDQSIQEITQAIQSKSEVATHLSAQKLESAIENLAAALQAFVKELARIRRS